MMMTLRRMRSDERGAALIVALLVSFVVMLLGTTVVSQAIHNSQQSAYDRRRLQSVGSAEAGLNHYFNYLAVTPTASLSLAPVSLAVGSSPGTSSVTVTPTFYADGAGTVAFFPPITVSNFPRSVRLLAVGTTNGKVARKMSSFVVLRPIFGGMTGAVVVNSGTTFSNNFTINGNSGSDGDVYVLSGDYAQSSGSTTIKGSLYVPNGSITVDSTSDIWGDAWAYASVTMTKSSVLVKGDVKSTTSSIDLRDKAVVNPGGAKYCTTLIGAINVAGPKVQTCALGPPPSQAFPQIGYNQADWQAQGYTNFVSYADCNAARSYVEGTGPGTFDGGSVGKTVVRITSNCTYTNSLNVTVTVGANLAIVTNGSITTSGTSNWNASGGTRQLHFLVPYGTSCAGNGNITFGNLTNFNSSVEAFVYSPCVVTMNNNNSIFSGQVIGATVNIGNLFVMNYRPVLVPGVAPTGYEQDIAYIREIK